MNSVTRTPVAWLATLSIALPWLNPFAPGPSPPVLQWLVTIVGAAVLLVLLALRQLDARSLAQATAQGFVLAALISSLMGVLQYFGVSEALSPWVNATGLGEAFANLRQRNQFATLTNIGLAALLWWPVPASAATASLPIDNAVAERRRLAMVALLALGNATSSSRTGMAQLLLLGLLVLIWRYLARSDQNPKTPGSAIQLILVAWAVYGLALLALPRLAGLAPGAHGLLARLAQGDSACGSRITLWGNVLHLIAQKPWLGWGWGELSYAHYSTLYPGLRFCDILDNAHNLPLHLAVELGLPVALALCVCTVWLTARAHPWRESDPAKRVAWAVLAVILLHSMLEYPLWYGPFMMAALLSLALLASPARRTEAAIPAAASAQALVRVAASSTAAALLVFAAFVAWDYHRISQIFMPAEQRDAAYRDDTLTKIHRSWLFRNHVRYAELTTTPVTRSNAAELHAQALELLHFSPETRVIEKAIESAVQLGLDDEALAQMQRFRAAFPEQYALWVKNGSAKRDRVAQ